MTDETLGGLTFDQPTGDIAPDTPPGDARVYCLFCRTGRERAVANEIEKRGVACMVPIVNRLVVKNGKESVQNRCLLPGYVFLETALSLTPGSALFRANPDSLRLLGYEYGQYALRDGDLAFYRWLKGRGGAIEVSQVYREGDFIRVVSGPLKAFAGRIVAVNKKRKCVAISLGENSLMSKIWCSVEYIERAQSSAPDGAG